MSSSGLVAVSGATGYLGNHLVKALRDAGVPVRCLVRGNAATVDTSFLSSLGAEVTVMDLSESGSEALSECFKDVISVVHLIGSIAPRKGESLELLHAAKTRQVTEAARAAGVGRFILVTALGAGATAPSEYHRTKWQSEEVVRNSGLDYLILRPSLIVGRTAGRRDSKLISRYRKLIAERPSVPLIEGGKNKLQPVFVGDLAAALVKAATGTTTGKTVEIGGAEVVTMRELVERLMDLDGSRKRIVALPAAVMRIVGHVLKMVQEVPLVSPDQVTLSQSDNICSANGIESEFGVKPVSLKEALETYKDSAVAAGTRG